ncbi:MAG: carbohydrate binding domain-containing protein, partial [Sinobacterium sp.]
EGDGGDEGDGGSDSSLSTLDFELDGYGATGFSWNVFENADNAPLEFVANPDTSGVNDSSTVAKIIARVDGQPWVGTETAHGDIGPFTLDASNSTIKIMVYKTVISDVGIKFAIANGGAQPEIKVANTLINQWEELTFDFSGIIGTFESIDIDQIIVFPDFDLAGRTQDNIVYFDNIRFFGENDGDDGTGDELVTNGSFSDGTVGWIGAVEVVSDSGNNVFYANVQAPGNPWDVNLSQVITLVLDETYVVSFKAKSPTARSIIVGLGLNHDPWTNVIENTALTDQWQTYTYTIT